MHISSFEDLLIAARQQAEPQRLLFVFAGAELADDSTPEQRARFEAGEGGSLAPLMAVDMAVDELAGFDALELEARQFGKDWVIVFVAALSGQDGACATGDAVTRALDQMMESIRQGRLSAYIPFDRQGRPVEFT
jgi:hypothetical protein